MNRTLLTKLTIFLLLISGLSCANQTSEKKHSNKIAVVISTLNRNPEQRAGIAQRFAILATGYQRFGILLAVVIEKFNSKEK